MAANKSKNIALPLSLLTATALLVGCGEQRIKVVPVTGKVTFKGQPPAGAQIVLHPQGITLPPDFAATGKVRDDGSFKITAYDEGDGAPPGEYVATVQWFKLTSGDGGAGRGPNVLPAKYSDPKTSPIKIKVNDSPTDVPPIEIGE